MHRRSSGAIEPLAPIVADPLNGLPAGGIVHGRRLRTLLALAEAQWRRWGGQRVSADRAGNRCAVIANGSCVVIDDGCGREQMPGLCGLVDLYWDSIHRTTGIRRFAHDCSRTGVCEARWPHAEAPIDTPAWSAAFVSALFTRAGFDATEFLPSPYHADYVVAARDGRTSAYVLTATPAWIAPGDMACLARPSRRLPVPPTRIDDVRASGLAGGPTPMHCDLVVAVDQSKRMAYAIGGNVMQAVSLVDIPLDASGRLSATLQPGQPWLLVMRMRDEIRTAN